MYIENYIEYYIQYKTIDIITNNYFDSTCTKSTITPLQLENIIKNIKNNPLQNHTNSEEYLHQLLLYNINNLKNQCYNNIYKHIYLDSFFIIPHYYEIKLYQSIYKKTFSNLTYNAYYILTKNNNLKELPELKKLWKLYLALKKKNLKELSEDNNLNIYIPDINISDKIELFNNIKSLTYILELLKNFLYKVIKKIIFKIEKKEEKEEEEKEEKEEKEEEDEEKEEEEDNEDEDEEDENDEEEDENDEEEDEEKDEEEDEEKDEKKKEKNTEFIITNSYISKFKKNINNNIIYDINSAVEIIESDDKLTRFIYQYYYYQYYNIQFIDDNTKKRILLEGIINFIYMKFKNSKITYLINYNIESLLCILYYILKNKNYTKSDNMFLAFFYNEKNYNILLYLFYDELYDIVKNNVNLYNLVNYIVEQNINFMFKNLSNKTILNEYIQKYFNIVIDIIIKKDLKILSFKNILYLNILCNYNKILNKVLNKYDSIKVNKLITFINSSNNITISEIKKDKLNTAIINNLIYTDNYIYENKSKYNDIIDILLYDTNNKYNSIFIENINIQTIINNKIVQRVDEYTNNAVELKKPPIIQRIFLRKKSAYIINDDIKTQPKITTDEPIPVPTPVPILTPAPAPIPTPAPTSSKQNNDNINTYNDDEKTSNNINGLLNKLNDDDDDVKNIINKIIMYDIFIYEKKICIIPNKTKYLNIFKKINSKFNKIFLNDEILKTLKKYDIQLDNYNIDTYVNFYLYLLNYYYKYQDLIYLLKIYIILIYNYENIKIHTINYKNDELLSILNKKKSLMEQELFTTVILKGGLGLVNNYITNKLAKLLKYINTIIKIEIYKSEFILTPEHIAKIRYYITTNNLKIQIDSYKLSINKYNNNITYSLYRFYLKRFYKSYKNYNDDILYFRLKLILTDYIPKSNSILINLSNKLNLNITYYYDNYILNILDKLNNTIYNDLYDYKPILNEISKYIIYTDIIYGKIKHKHYIKYNNTLKKYINKDILSRYNREENYIDKYINLLNNSDVKMNDELLETRLYIILDYYKNIDKNIFYNTPTNYIQNNQLYINEIEIEIEIEIKEKLTIFLEPILLNSTNNTLLFNDLQHYDIMYYITNVCYMIYNIYDKFNKNYYKLTINEPIKNKTIEFLKKIYNEIDFNTITYNNDFIKENYNKELITIAKLQ